MKRIFTEKLKLVRCLLEIIYVGIERQLMSASPHPFKNLEGKALIRGH